MMIESGSLVVNSLQQSSKVVGNTVFEKSIIRVSEQVSKGVPMGDAMSSNNLYPAVLVELVKIGEQTGKLDESLYKSSEYFERETEITIKKLTTALEPMIILVLGIGIAFLLFSVITPIYQITSSF
jgi:type IV pilus assembly protein PilC